MQYLYLNKDFDDIDDYYEVEKIITRKSKGKNTLYLIKWLGYPITDCTWEPISHLDKVKTLVEQFDDNFPNSIDKRQLRKYLDSINKGNKVNKHRFINRNKIIQKRNVKNKINENNHLIINLEDFSLINKDLNEDEKVPEVDSLIGGIEIPKQKKDEYKNVEEEPTDLTEDNDEPKLIKPIIIW